MSLVPPPSPPARPDPAPHIWTEADVQRAAGRFVSVSRDLVETDVYVRIWNDGSSRGCPSAACVVPVLAYHTWPAPGAEWTPWFALSHRHIAALAGINKGSVKVGFDHLGRLGLAEVRLERQHPRDGGLFCNEYRLHCSLYPAKGAPFFRLFGSLIVGGVLAMLPRASARHLLPIICALDPIYDEAELRETVRAGREEGSVADRMIRLRDDCRATAGYLTTVSGMSTSSVAEALAILSVPLFGSPVSLPLVKRGKGRWGHYYYPNHAALEWTWRPEILNSPHDRERLTHERWGHLLAPAKRRAEESRVRTKRARDAA